MCTCDGSVVVVTSVFCCVSDHDWRHSFSAVPLMAVLCKLGGGAYETAVSGIFQESVTCVQH